jgi:IPT/TIG domain
MIDAYVLLLTPILLLGIVALLGLLGCDAVLGLEDTRAALPAPAVQPLFGSPAGGEKCTVTGSGLESGATVSFGGAAAAPDFTNFISSSEIDITQTPRHSPGVVDVVVINPGGAFGTLSKGYVYSVTENDTAVASSTGNTALQLNPVEGQLVVVTALWSGAGTLSFTASPATTFTLVKQDDLTQNIHIAIYVANQLTGPVSIRGIISGALPPTFSLIATGYDFSDPNQAFTPDQFASLQGAGTMVSLPLQISDLAPGDLIYAVALSRNSSGVLTGGVTALSNSNLTVSTRSMAPIPAYFLVDDQVLLPGDISPTFNVTATASSPAANWYMFAMRIRVATS